MNQKPKIVAIGLKGLPAFGGAAVVGESIINQLKEKYDFTVLSIASHTSLKTGDINGIKQIVFNNFGYGGFNTFIYYLKCLYHCLLHKYDLVHLHHAESGFITPLLRLKYKIVVTFHGVFRSNDPKFSSFHNKFFKLSEKLNVKYANEIISVSKPDQEYIFKKYGKEIKYIPNGITINFAKEIYKKSGDSEEYILFAAARIYEIKGLHLLLKAVKNLNLNIEVKVAGDLDQVDDYKRTISKLSEGLKVKFLGLIKNKSELFNLIVESKLFIFPSLTEAMSMMLLEVVSLKTPVIASDIPSNKAIFSEDELLFFRSNDENDLAKKLKYALGHNSEIEFMALRAYQKVKDSYTWSSVCQQYKDIFSYYLKI